MRPAKTQISQPSVQSDQFSIIACSFYSLRAIQRRINVNPCHAEWMYRRIWVFPGYTDLIEGFVVRCSFILSKFNIHENRCWGFICSDVSLGLSFSVEGKYASFTESWGKQLHVPRGFRFCLVWWAFSRAIHPRRPSTKQSNMEVFIILWLLTEIQFSN